MGNKQKEYAEMEKSNFSTEDFRRPAYAARKSIREQGEQIQHMQADEYLKSKMRSELIEHT